MDDNIFVISKEDIQNIAQKRFGRKLSVEELEQVQKGVEFGLECWQEVVLEAISEVLESKKGSVSAPSKN